MLLVFVKYRDPKNKDEKTDSGMTEVHTAKPDGDDFVHHAVTEGRLNDALNGTWAAPFAWVYFIKTKNTDSSTVEVHSLSSSYEKWDIHSPSGFSVDEAKDGTYTIDRDYQLWFIKTKNTSSGMIEVAMGDKNNNYAAGPRQKTSVKLPVENTKAIVTIQDKDLYLIKPSDTSTGRVEVTIATHASGYQNHKTYATWFSTKDAENGVWQINRDGDLYFIKTRNAESNRVEVHYSTKYENYEDIHHHHTVFELKDADNGAVVSFMYYNLACNGNDPAHFLLHFLLTGQR